jgi:hypothetical protein
MVLAVLGSVGWTGNSANPGCGAGNIGQRRLKETGTQQIDSGRASWLGIPEGRRISRSAGPERATDPKKCRKAARIARLEARPLLAKPPPGT